MDDLINTFIVEFNERWFGNRVNVYHHCNVDKNKLMNQDTITIARNFTHNGLFGKLIYCSMNPAEYQKMWKKADRHDNTILLRQLM